MSDTTFLSQRGKFIAGGIIVLLLIFFAFGFEPVTRNVVAVDSFCIDCHVSVDYLYSTRMSHTSPHPPKPKDGQTPARCVDCHLPEGTWSSVYAYTHFVSVTDLYGHFRDREGERSGDWIPLSAARAYRVRDRMLEDDSPTCRNCHDISKMKLDSIRAQNSHDDAMKNADTCIECHKNLVHRPVAARKVETEEQPEEGAPANEFQDFNEFDEFEDVDQGGGDAEVL